jgi:predicted transposase/invertase (TIGR01784 family)
MYFKKFDDLTFADHYMFEKVLHENQDVCQELLERLLKIKIDHIEYPEIEKTISPYYETKGVRLDVYVKDSNKVFDIELQNINDEDLLLRTRFYQSMLDTDNLLKGQHYSELPKSFVIFICRYDPIGKNLPIYTFENRCLENLEISLNDKSIKKIFNATAYNQEKDLEISAFLEYIYNQEAVDDFTTKLTSIVERIKEQEINRKEYNSMNLHDQDNFRRGKKEGYSAGLYDGISQGKQQKAIETAKNMLSASLGTLEQIAQITNLPLDTVKDLAEK